MRLFEVSIYPSGYFVAEPLTIGLTQLEVDSMDGVTELPPARSQVVAGCVQCAIRLLAEVQLAGHA
jgi:hypothetical protein